MVCNFYHWWENKLTLESFYFTHTCFFLKRFTLQNIGVQNILQRMRNTESTKQRRHSDWINGIAEVDVPAQFGPTPLRSGLKCKDAFGRWADLQRFLSIEAVFVMHSEMALYTYPCMGASPTVCMQTSVCYILRFGKRKRIESAFVVELWMLHPMDE